MHVVFAAFFWGGKTSHFDFAPVFFQQMGGVKPPSRIVQQIHLLLLRSQKEPRKRLALRGKKYTTFIDGIQLLPTCSRYTGAQKKVSLVLLLEESGFTIHIIILQMNMNWKPQFTKEQHSTKSQLQCFKTGHHLLKWVLGVWDYFYKAQIVNFR